MTKMKSKNFNIMMIATMSSGKSTLINAILGGELCWIQAISATRFPV